MNKLFIVYKYLVLLILLATAGLFTTGCESSTEEEADGKYTFENKSTREVTLYTSHYMITTTDKLPPGASIEKTGWLEDNTYNMYYDYAPKNTVVANQIHNDKIVFEDKP